MKLTIMVLLLSVPAIAQQWTLCAKVSPLRLNQGESVELGRQSSPILWGFSRDVLFQACTPDGRPVQRRVQLVVEIEPLGGQFGAVNLATREAVSDSRGRFSATYGAGGLQPGEAWPEGAISRERHRFVFEGRTVATFLLERTSRDLRFLQDLEMASRTVPSGNSTNKPSATAPASSFNAKVSPQM